MLNKHKRFNFKADLLDELIELTVIEIDYGLRFKPGESEIIEGVYWLQSKHKINQKILKRICDKYKIEYIGMLLMDKTSKYKYKYLLKGGE